MHGMYTRKNQKRKKKKKKKNEIQVMKAMVSGNST